jgi:hypothetical protein
MKLIKLTTLVALTVVLAFGVFTIPAAIVRAQTGAAGVTTSDPDILRELAGGIHRLTGLIPAGGAVVLKHTSGAGSGSLEVRFQINDQFPQIAWFGPDMVASSAGSPVSLTSPTTGYKSTFSPSGRGSNYRLVEVFDSMGNLLTRFDLQIS